MASTVPRPSFWVLIPPPPLFVAAYFAGRALQRLAPLPFPVVAARILAAPLLLAAAWLVLTPPLLFLLRRTTIIPQGDARTLITDGPYRVTRNPMYLGLSLALASVALLTATPWALLFVALPVTLLQTRTIPFEERTLDRIFGAEYAAYRGRVRRWL